MTISVTLRADNAIIIYDEDDPRNGVVIETISEAVDLVTKLNAVVNRIYGEEACKRARMRALMEAVAEAPEHLN